MCLKDIFILIQVEILNNKIKLFAIFKRKIPDYPTRR